MEDQWVNKYTTHISNTYRFGNYQTKMRRNEMEIKYFSEEWGNQTQQHDMVWLLFFCVYETENSISNTIKITILLLRTNQPVLPCPALPCQPSKSLSSRPSTPYPLYNTPCIEEVISILFSETFRSLYSLFRVLPYVGILVGWLSGQHRKHWFTYNKNGP